MQLIAVAFAVVVIVSSAIVNNQNPEPTPTPEVIAATDEASPTPTAEPTPTQTDQPTAEPTQATTQAEFYYPGATIQESGEYDLYLISSDSADDVTAWYQSYIEDSGYNIKNFVKTKVNGEVENRLVGANSESEIDIEITTAEGNTHIRINY